MVETGPHYEVSMTIEKPNFDKERRYLLVETEYVKRQLETAQKPRWWSGFGSAKMGFYTREDWQRYLHELEKYAHQLDRHEQEIENGLVPFKIYVANDGDAADDNIVTRVTVKNGAINEKKKPPKRPTRLDGNGNAVDKPHFPAFSRFSRSNIRISERHLEAEFSYLEANDEAELVRRVLYVSAGSNTQFFYEINSRQVHDVRGEVLYLF